MQPARLVETAKGAPSFSTDIKKSASGYQTPPISNACSAGLPAASMMFSGYQAEAALVVLTRTRLKSPARSRKVPCLIRVKQPVGRLQFPPATSSCSKRISCFLRIRACFQYFAPIARRKSTPAFLVEVGLATSNTRWCLNTPTAANAPGPWPVPAPVHRLR